MTRVRAPATRFATETFTERDGLAQNQVFAVHRARDGAVWAGTLSRGASRLKDGAFTTYTTTDGLASNTVAAVLEAADGAVWFATPNGASVKSPAGWRRYSTADGLPSNDVNTLFEDSARNLWIGTAAGLAVMHEGRMQSLPGVPALLRASILGLAEDRAGGLWIAATDHVLRVDREKLLRGTLGAGDVREFSAADGLLDTEAIKRHRILTADSRGRIWLSTNGGLVMADSRRVAAGIAPALVQVEDVSADGSPVERAARGRSTIPPRPDRITFGFAALSLSVPDRVRFRYRLDGFDRDWSEPVAERQAVFTNLGPGTYRFRVIASNSEGVWNSAEAALPFTIAPAWWQMGSFWAAIGLLVAGGIWGGYRMRLRQLARQLDVRFEERLAERSRIARELHDTLLQSFQGAVLRFRAVTYMLPDRPADARATLENAIDQARQAIVEGRDAVQGLRSPAIATNDIAVAIATLAETLSTDDGSQSPPVFQVNVEGTPRDLPPIVQDEVYRIAGEALRNAFRHARASRIEVEIRYDQSRFRAARARRRQGHRRRGGRWTDLRGTLRHGWHARARETARRHAVGLERARLRHRGGADDSGVGRIREVGGGMSDSPAIRILTVDDHPLFRNGVAALLASQPDMQLVAEGANGREAIRQFRAHRPDVTLMDLQMPEMSGLEATIAIRAEFPDARIIVLTTYAGDVQVLRALQAGARGVSAQDAWSTRSCSRRFAASTAARRRCRPRRRISSPSTRRTSR